MLLQLTKRSLSLLLDKLAFLKFISLLGLSYHLLRILLFTFCGLRWWDPINGFLDLLFGDFFLWSGLVEYFHFLESFQYWNIKLILLVCIVLITLWKEFNHVFRFLDHFKILQRGVFLPVNTHIFHIEVINHLYIILYLRPRTRTRARATILHSKLDPLELFILVYFGSQLHEQSLLTDLFQRFIIITGYSF